MNTPRRHVFISHHFADDDSVTRLTTMMHRGGWDVRNSSIRLKQANQQRLDRGEIADRTLERVLRRKITWAQTVIVVIGTDTHSRPWVQYEIEQAHKQGKNIVGVYAHGCSSAILPHALEKYASSIVAWNTEAIMAAVDEVSHPFQNEHGEERIPQSETSRHTC